MSDSTTTVLSFHVDRATVLCVFILLLLLYFIDTLLSFTYRVSLALTFFNHFSMIKNRCFTFQILFNIKIIVAFHKLFYIIAGIVLNNYIVILYIS